MVRWEELWWNSEYGQLCWIGESPELSWRSFVRYTYKTGYPSKGCGTGEEFKERPLTKGLLYW